MKEKKLTKEQKENRKHKIEKFKLIGLIISVLVNAFFIVSCSVGLASGNGNKEVAAKVDEQNAFYQKNNLGSFDDLDYYNGSTGYYLGSGNYVLRPSKLTRQYITDYYVSLGSNMACVVRDANDSVKALDESWHIYFHIAKPVVDNDYIRIETPNWTRVYSVNLSSDSWNVQTISPENYTYEELYLPTFLNYSAENYQRFREDMQTYFSLVQYTDYQLNNNWSPMNVLQDGNDYLFFSNQGAANPDKNLEIITNPIFTKSYKILDSTLFSINGKLYTDLLCHVQDTQNARCHWYRENYTDFVDITFGGGGQRYFADFVYAYNNSSEDYQVIWRCPYDDDDNVYSVYTFESGFTNNRLSQIRLFNRHLGIESIPGYTNGNVLNVNGNPIATNTSVQGNMGDVFALFTSAFSGLAGLFSITILPGITIGMLLFLPLVAIIVFAIIKIIKK